MESSSPPTVFKTPFPPVFDPQTGKYVVPQFSSQPIPTPPPPYTPKPLLFQQSQQQELQPLGLEKPSSIQEQSEPVFKITLNQNQSERTITRRGRQASPPPTHHRDRSRSPRRNHQDQRYRSISPSRERYLNDHQQITQVIRDYQQLADQILDLDRQLDRVINRGLSINPEMFASRFHKLKIQSTQSDALLKYNLDSGYWGMTDPHTIQFR